MHSWHCSMGPDRIQDVFLKKEGTKMEKIKEITARNKAIDEYNSMRDRLFGKAVYFASDVKITLDAHGKSCTDERGDVTIFKESFERLKAMAEAIEKENRKLEDEFRNLFIEPYKQEGENG